MNPTLLDCLFFGAHEERNVSVMLAVHPQGLFAFYHLKVRFVLSSAFGRVV